MERKTVFIASDGEQFFDEVDCITYETELMWAEIKDEVVFFSHNEKLDKDITTMCEECTAFYCKSEEGANALDDLFDYTINWSPLSDAGVYKEGLYLYSSYQGRWIHYVTETQQLKNEAEMYLEKVAEGNI